MNATLEAGKAVCVNEKVRQAAHNELDRLFDDTDGVRGWFGEIGVKVPVGNGQYAPNLKIIREQNVRV